MGDLFISSILGVSLNMMGFIIMVMVILFQFHTLSFSYMNYMTI